jgi:hypothetical protein
MAKTKKALAIAGVTLGLMCTGVGAASANSGSGTTGSTTNSGGVLSGDVIQIPIDIGTNICGNSINVIGIGNWVFGNACGTVS